MELNQKYEYLKKYLSDLGSLAVAFSGGVDSTFLLKVAHDVLRDKVIGVTATSSTYPRREFEEACKYVKDIGVEHVVINSEELDIEGFSKNPKNRCYYCKKELFSKIQEVAKEKGIDHVADGSNYDDLGDFRPGMGAAQELEVVSPLKAAEMTKDDIRALSRELNLPTWNKPAFACLSSRFPYGEEITAEKLQMVDAAEEFLLGLGLRQLRVRHHGDIARIEIAPSERNKLFSEDIMDRISDKLKEIGFTYVTMELGGYRTGSMNDVLRKKGEI